MKGSTQADESPTIKKASITTQLTCGYRNCDYKKLFKKCFWQTSFLRILQEGNQQDIETWMLLNEFIFWYEIKINNNIPALSAIKPNKQPNNAPDAVITYKKQCRGIDSLKTVHIFFCKNTLIRYTYFFQRNGNEWRLKLYLPYP